MNPLRQKDVPCRDGDEFWRGKSFEELAREQGVRPVERLEDLLGGWPEEEVNDGFEEALLEWRKESLSWK